ncbi:MAG: redox-regulated ATPase YchF [Actinobacteria bacterium]|nr:redox-regulated ATPase YchF [Actinomycetota bacterium]
MRLGIIGLPQSGKTSLFNALTGGEAPVAAGGYGQDTHVAVVKVPDARLDRLTEMFSPKKTTPAEVHYLDFPGAGFGSRDRSEVAWVGQLRTVDALVIVVRAFTDPSVPNDGPIDPVAALEKVQLDLVVADLAVVERKRTRLESDLKKTKTAERAPIEAEIALFEEFQKSLEEGQPLRAHDLSPDQLRDIRGFQFLTLKPVLVLVNVGEDQLGDRTAIEELAFVGYVLTIPGANLMLVHVGWAVDDGGPRLLPVGFGLMAPSGVFVVGVALWLRDLVQDYYGTRWAAAAIGIGVVLTAVLAAPALAVASACAFAVSELSDFAVYTPLRSRSAWLATVASGVVGGVVDSVTFLFVAFGSLAFVEGQVVGKVLITCVVALWRWRAS